MPKYKIKNETVLYEFMDRFWGNIGKRKGNKFIKNLFKRDILGWFDGDSYLIILTQIK